MFEYEVIPGAIVVNEVVPVIDHDDVKVIEIDLMSKYPGAVVTFTVGSDIGVSIHANNETLKTDLTYPLAQATEIRFSVGDPFDWTIVATGSRYTVRIAIYRRSETT